MNRTCWLAIGVVITGVVGLYLIAESAQRAEEPARAPIEVKVVAHEWWWEFDFRSLASKLRMNCTYPKEAWCGWS